MYDPLSVLLDELLAMDNDFISLQWTGESKVTMLQDEGQVWRDIHGLFSVIICGFPLVWSLT